MKKVFALKNEGFHLTVDEGEIIDVSEQGDEGECLFIVRFANGDIEEYIEEDLYKTREAAETEAARLNEERDRVWQDVAEDAREWMWA